jgi:hypothetical protein
VQLFVTFLVLLFLISRLCINGGVEVVQNQVASLLLLVLLLLLLYCKADLGPAGDYTIEVY